MTHIVLYVRMLTLSILCVLTHMFVFHCNPTLDPELFKLD